MSLATASGRHEAEAAGRSCKFHNNGVEEDAVVKEDEKRRLAGGSLFVKVKMDGMPIGRKVDLSAYRAYKTLALALEEMFQKPYQECKEDLKALGWLF